MRFIPRYFNLFCFFMLSISSYSSYAVTTWLGESYCQLRHPVESLTSKRTTCESQHVIQQQAGGKDALNTIWINTKLHDYLDRSKQKKWATARPWSDINVGTVNLERAYMMGTYANGYHFVVYDYNQSGSATLLAWDGASQLLYVVAGVINFITKEMSYIGYQWHGSKNTQVFDALIGIPIDLVEVLLGTVYGLLGVVVGTILHPIDTIFNIPQLLLFLVETILTALVNTVLNLLSLLSLGYF